jgi:3-isopropylmalate dehydrogenase
MIESTRMLIEWLGHNRKRPEAVAAAQSMSRATTAALGDPRTRTGDIRGTGDTAAMTRAVIRGIEQG